MNQTLFLRPLVLFFFLSTWHWEVSSQIIMSTIGNTELACIAVNNPIESAEAPGWRKDQNTNYGESCSVLSIGDFKGFNFKILQNPVIDRKLRFITSKPGTLSIHSVTGRLILRTSNAKQGENLFSVQGLSANLYIATLQSQNSKIIHKLIIK